MDYPTPQDILESRHPYLICTLRGFDHDRVTEYYVNGIVVERKDPPSFIKPSLLVPIIYNTLY